MIITYTLSDKDFNEMFSEINKREGYGFDDKKHKEIKELLQKAGLYRNKPVMEILEELMNSVWHRGY